MGSYSKLLKAKASLDLLILDDWSPEPSTAATRNDLMEIMDDRYEQSATIIISHLPKIPSETALAGRICLLALRRSW